MSDLDDNAMFSGFTIGILIGGIIALFRAPRIKFAQLKQLTQLSENPKAENDNKRHALLSAITPVDPINESIAEGKKAARRRRTELGLDQDD